MVIHYQDWRDIFPVINALLVKYAPKGDQEHVGSVVCVAEEAGEFAAAWRRWSGRARRSGTFEEMGHELADTVIASFTAAQCLGIDLPKMIMEKGQIILDREG